MRTLLSSLVFSCAPLCAQSINVDVGANGSYPVPGSTYAAAGSAGVWNAVSAQANGAALVDTSGAATTATVGASGGFLDFDFDNFGTSGDDQLLLDDAQDVGGLASSATWTFQGLVDGDYFVTTYAWAPDNPAFTTRVSVAGSPDADQVVGGPWTGSLVLGVTHARHRATAVGGQIFVTVTAENGFGSLNGIQLERASVFTTFCFGDGSGTACPCGNASAVGAGEGCLNSLGFGGTIAASGTSSVASDSMQLAGAQMPNSSALYFQGTNQAASGAGVVFGDGLRCAGGAILRLGTKINAANASSYPQAGDVSISIKGAVSAGDVRTYQVWYRNGASFCAPETFNLTNGVSATWAP